MPGDAARGVQRGVQMGMDVLEFELRVADLGVHSPDMGPALQIRSCLTLRLRGIPRVDRRDLLGDLRQGADDREDVAQDRVRVLGVLGAQAVRSGRLVLVVEADRRVRQGTDGFGSCVSVGEVVAEGRNDVPPSRVETARSPGVRKMPGYSAGPVGRDPRSLASGGGVGGSGTSRRGPSVEGRSTAANSLSRLACPRLRLYTRV